MHKLPEPEKSNTKAPLII